MKKLQVILPIVLSAIAILAVLTVGNSVMQVKAQLEGVSNANGIHLSQSTFGTATPQFQINNDGNNQSLRVLDSGGTPEVVIDADGGMTVNALTAGGALDLNGQELTLDADADTSITASTDDQIDIELAGTDEITVTAATVGLNDTIIRQDVGTENLGVLPSVVSTAITYTAAAGGSGTVATIADGEIWLVHSVFVRTTTNFDCTGDDCTLTIGDGNDADGFIVAADANMQATFTEATGYAAGWYGIENGSNGAYTVDDGGPFVYAPSGSAETIDWALAAAGDDFSAGAATIYVVYTRIQ